jgi:murein DD-endopeptidase MepM/ murein hydrolase activator NlpD
MADEFYTLILVPHAKAKFRKLQVSAKLVRWTAGAAAVLAIAILGILVHYAVISVELAELHRLRAENEALQKKTQAYEEGTSRLNAKVQQLQGMVTKLAVMAGLDQSLPSPAVGGVGGVSSLESRAPSQEPDLSLPEMERSVNDLTARSARLTTFYQDQKILLAATPSIWPVRGYLSATFGNRVDPFTGQQDFHPGIDVSTPLGTKIVAPADGVVVAAGVRGGYGNALIIDHGYGIVTRYAHLDRFNVRPGQRVRRGDVIAFVGNTGKSTAPHLHYEVWVRDQTQNPIHFILDEYRSFG